MENLHLTEALPKFVQHTLDCCDGQDPPLTVNHLRLCIRHERMSEISDWSNCLLDLIEMHAAQFDGHDPLDCVLELPAEDGQAGYAASLSSIGTPSPFAWT